jgi:hypothetical protein
MLSDLDIYRAANLLIDRYGADAMIEAARLMHLMLDRCDRDGQFVWLRISEAIFVLQAPSTGTAH